MTHKHEDLKLTAVRYYLDNDILHMLKPVEFSIVMKEV